MAELVRRGSITAEEAESHPHRNVITRALGAEAEVQADTVSTGLRDGDVVLLCSDGLSSYVPEADIAAVLADAGTPDRRGARPGGPRQRRRRHRQRHRGPGAGRAGARGGELGRHDGGPGGGAGDAGRRHAHERGARAGRRARARRQRARRVRARPPAQGARARRPAPLAGPPDPRRRGRAAVVVGGAVLWIASRTYTVEGGRRAPCGWRTGCRSRSSAGSCRWSGRTPASRPTRFARPSPTPCHPRREARARPSGSRPRSCGATASPSRRSSRPRRRRRRPPPRPTPRTTTAP